jgi:surface antigen
MKRLLAFGALFAAPAMALNLTDDAPMAQFKGKDQGMFDSTLYGVLDHAKDGVNRSWSNPETKAGGEVKAIKSFTRDDVPCRTVHVSNKAGGRTSSADYNFCRSSAGNWVLAK